MSKRQLVTPILACMALLQSAWGAATPMEAVSEAIRTADSFPAGIKLVSLNLTGSAIEVDLSPEAAPADLGETQVDGMCKAIVSALAAWPEFTAFEITVKGKPLWQYLPISSAGEAPLEVEPLTDTAAPVETATTELAGKLVMLHPSHGSYWHQGYNYWFRAMRTLCGPNPVSNRPPGWTGSTYQPSDYYYWTAGYQWDSFYEDDMSPETIRFLMKYVESSGAEVWVSRNLDKSAGNYDYAGFGYPNCSFPLPKWQVAAKYYLQEIGMPSWVWDEPALTAQTDKDIRSRPYYANYRMAQKFPGQDQSSQSVWGNCVSLHLHSNAAGSGTARGTETFWYTSTYPYLQTEATRLAGNVNTGAVRAIRDYYDGFWAESMYVAGTTPAEWPSGTYYGYQQAGTSTTRWQDRGVKTNNFGEIREAKMPAVLCELAFHDDWKFYPDHVFMTDQIFRAAVAWGFYEGICNQFYVTPKPRLAATVVATDFPSQVAPGATINGTVTMQNQGMAWCWGHKFDTPAKTYNPYTIWKLKAASNDQFTPGTKIAIDQAAVIYPGQNATFAVTMTAPTTPGLYTTRWRMVKDDARGGGDFGSTATAEILVQGPAPTITAIDPNRHANTGTVNVELTGTDFADGATVKLSQAGQPDIIASDVVRVSDLQITCTLDLAGASSGAWDVVVTNPVDQSDDLPGGFVVCNNMAAIGDFDLDCDVDAEDILLFANCASGPAVTLPQPCAGFDLDGDGDADQQDFAKLQRCLSGAGIADPDCGT